MIRVEQGHAGAAALRGVFSEDRYEWVEVGRVVLHAARDREAPASNPGPPITPSPVERSVRDFLATSRGTRLFGRLLVDRAAGRPIYIPAGWVGGRGTCSLADPSSAEPPMRTLLDGCQDRRERPQRVS